MSEHKTKEEIIVDIDGIVHLEWVQRHPNRSILTANQAKECMAIWADQQTSLLTQQLADKEKEIEKLKEMVEELDKTTKLIEWTDGVITMDIVECCSIGPIINENYCPNCRCKIIRTHKTK